ncbi:MAG: hypothetical protein KJZ69_18410 [Phycisphaerales bacterium]|nr:hypothetical protein [Phycisphaerales bacterium]
MPLTFIQHRKIQLRTHPEFNEAWLHDRIADDPAILGLGEVRVLDRERSLPGGGRLDMLLLDDESNRRYEVEIMLGGTDPSHIIRTIEYWDLERRRYPGYDHVAVLIAEDITARCLNVMGLLAGSIPLIAIQLDAIQVNEHILLNFVQVLDQTALRIDDTDGDDGGGGQVDRAHWEKKVGAPLMKVCDGVLQMINAGAKHRQEFNYLRGYMGLQSNGVVRNFIFISPKRTKKFVHIHFRNSNSETWVQRFDEANIEVRSKQPGRMRVTVSPTEFQKHEELLRQAIAESVKEAEA